MKEITIMMRSQIRTLAVVAAMAAAGLVGATALAACGSSGQPAARPTAGASAPSGTQASAQYSYPYYRLMMGRYFSGGSMMGGGSYGWMMGPAGYRWMTGGNGVPGWMRGGHFPAFMMGTVTDMGKFMGRLWAGAPGPRVTPAQAARLGRQAPAGATVNTTTDRITFHIRDARLTVLASPSMPAENFRIAGLTNPAIVVPAGAQVTVTFINADPDMAHGLVVTAGGARSSRMPMMTSRPAFPGSALWFLGNPTAAGMHAGTLTFTASTPGTYHYLCPVPGHAQKGTAGTFIVTGAR